MKYKDKKKITKAPITMVSKKIQVVFWSDGQEELSELLNRDEEEEKKEQREKDGKVGKRPEPKSLKSSSDPPPPPPERLYLDNRNWRPCRLEECEKTKPLDYSWVTEMNKKRFFDLCDVNEGEKKTLWLWNTYLEDKHGRGMRNLNSLLHNFITDHVAKIQTENLYRNMLLFLASFQDTGLIDQKDLRDLEVHLQKSYLLVSDDRQLSNEPPTTPPRRNQKSHLLVSDDRQLSNEPRFQVHSHRLGDCHTWEPSPTGNTIIDQQDAIPSSSSVRICDNDDVGSTMASSDSREASGLPLGITPLFDRTSSNFDRMTSCTTSTNDRSTTTACVRRALPLLDPPPSRADSTSTSNSSIIPRSPHRLKRSALRSRLSSSNSAASPGSIGSSPTRKILEMVTPPPAQAQTFPSVVNAEYICRDEVYPPSGAARSSKPPRKLPRMDSNFWLDGVVNPKSRGENLDSDDDSLDLQLSESDRSRHSSSQSDRSRQPSGSSVCNRLTSQGDLGQQLSGQTVRGLFGRPFSAAGGAPLLDRRERIMMSAVGVQRHREMEPGADGQTWREEGGGQIDRRRRHSSGKQINDILASFLRMDKGLQIGILWLAYNSPELHFCQLLENIMAFAANRYFKGENVIHHERIMTVKQVSIDYDDDEVQEIDADGNLVERKVACIAPYNFRYTLEEVIRGVHITRIVSSDLIQRRNGIFSREGVGEFLDSFLATKSPCRLSASVIDEYGLRDLSFEQVFTGLPPPAFATGGALPPTPVSLTRSASPPPPPPSSAPSTCIASSPDPSTSSLPGPANCASPLLSLPPDLSPPAQPSSGTATPQSFTPLAPREDIDLESDVPCLPVRVLESTKSQIYVSVDDDDDGDDADDEDGEVLANESRIGTTTKATAAKDRSSSISGNKSAEANRRRHRGHNARASNTKVLVGESVKVERRRSNDKAAESVGVTRRGSSRISQAAAADVTTPEEGSRRATRSRQPRTGSSGRHGKNEAAAAAAKNIRLRSGSLAEAEVEALENGI